MKKKKSISAAEFLRQLEADPEFQAQQAERDRAFKAKEEAYARAEAPLVNALRLGGVDVNSVWDLVNTNTDYTGVLPILVEHLQHHYPDAIRDGIARALAVPAASFAWMKLREHYLTEQSPRARQGFAAALSNAASAEHMEMLISLASDPLQGESRALLLDALRRLRPDKARIVLMRLGEDPELRATAQTMLRRLSKRRK